MTTTTTAIAHNAAWSYSQAPSMIRTIDYTTSTVLTATKHYTQRTHLNPVDNPNIQSESPFFICPFCGERLTNRSWHWIQWDIRTHWRSCSGTKPGVLSFLAPLDNGASVSDPEAENGLPALAHLSSTTRNSPERGVMDHDTRKGVPIRDYKGLGK